MLEDQQVPNYMCFLTALVDIQLLYGYVAGLHARAVQVLVLQIGFFSLLPQLDPTDITAAVKNIVFQLPV